MSETPLRVGGGGRVAGGEVVEDEVGAAVGNAFEQRRFGWHGWPPGTFVAGSAFIVS